MSRGSGTGGSRVLVAVATGAALVLGGFTCTNAEQIRDRFANSYWEHRGELMRVERSRASPDAGTRATGRELRQRVRKLQAWLWSVEVPSELAVETSKLLRGLDLAAFELTHGVAVVETDAAHDISRARRHIDSVVGLR